MKIALIQGHMFNRGTWSKVAERLAPKALELIVFPQSQAEAAIKIFESGEIDAVIANLTRDLPGYDDLLEAAGKVPIRVGLGLEMARDFSNLSWPDLARFQAYLAKISQDNYVNGVKFLASLAGLDIAHDDIKPVTTEGIYHFGSASPFQDTAEYFDWLQGIQGVHVDQNVIGLVFYYGQLYENKLAEINAAIKALEEHDLAPLCVFTEGTPNGSQSMQQRYPWLRFLKDAGAQLGAILNFSAGRFLSSSDDNQLLQELNVPVLQLVRLWGRTIPQWEDDPAGLPAQALVYAMTQPELAGLIEPTVVAAADEGPGGEADRDKGMLPVVERIDHVCRRLKKWLRLRRLSNSEKRITFVLHNAPCKGVEATVGLGVGLDVFQSLARTLQAMKQAGYDVGEAPAQGKAILDHIMDKKAISEFRWTTVDEIVRKGGVLHMTDREEYQPFLESLPPQARSKLLEDWEDFPGQGMVYSREDGEEVLLITGVKYGKVRIMLQPKRGCYGPKCTGEVCRILHDPNLAPPHHWLAAYKYIQDNSDAVVHFGCHGALEFLPGKRAGLSRECFSDISLGDLPNIYPYVMDVPGEGLVAKRRGNAVIIDHLTPAYRPTGLDQQTGRLVNILEQYQRALDMEEAQRAELLQGEALPLLRELKLVEEDYQGETDFPETVDRALRQMKLSQDHLAPEGLHLLGLPPEPQEEAMMLAGICQRDQEIAALLADVTQKRGGDPEDFDDRSLVFKDLIGGQVAAGELGKDSDLQALEHWALNASALIRQSREEIEQVLSALDGGYIKPGLSGSLMMGKIQALPTGRNFFAVDVAALPTRAAWETGCGMADQLLLRHLNQEGRIPESVGHNLWSIDAFKSDGELLCMILYLMGARPLWDSQDRVTGIEAIPLSELFLETGEGEIQQRPRVDVLVQTSGIVRDMVPNFIELLDQAVMLIGSLDEGPDSNYIRRHNSERLEQLRQELNGDADPDHLLRLASYRVFTSPPGSYGIGVGLAIDASAWESDQDLAEVYVNWGGYAYGQGAYGLEAHDLYAGHLQNIDVSYMKQYSPEYDLLDCGCYASYQGGMSLAAKAVGGKDTKLYWSDNSASGQADICDLKTGLETAFRAKLNNQRWIENMKKHGFQGAMAVSNKVNNLFKWSVTSRQVDKWLFDAVTENFIQNPENLAWLRENNPYALEEITRRLLEAESRGLWEASPDLLAAVQAAALAVEGDMEEVMGEVTEEFQGSKVEILTAQQVEKWQPTWRLGQG